MERSGGYFFSKEIRPTYLIQRSDILDYKNREGYQLSSDEKKWFDENYHLIRVFKYNPEDYSTNPLFLKIMKLGTASDYYLFSVLKQ